ncbi:RNase adapter RapZ [bacterium]|nr:RNase adapter RapZ [bacterium]
MTGSLFYLVTGMAGAGKSTVLNALEDSGFFCVDNLPVALFDKFFELIVETIEHRANVALATDLRSGKHFSTIMSSLKILSVHNVPFQVIFLDCENDALVQRFKETRRRHPLYKGNLLEAIRKERRLLSPILANANQVIDTTNLKTRDLNQKISGLLRESQSEGKLHIALNSFGFKFGIPKDADFVFDVRFMDNPFYVEELRTRSGLDADVMNYVFSTPKRVEFVQKLSEFLAYLLPFFIEEGRTQLVIAIGCTGGQHRSVATVEKLFASLSGLESFVLSKYHRDCREGIL